MASTLPTENNFSSLKGFSQNLLILIYYLAMLKEQTMANFQSVGVLLASLSKSFA